VIIAGGAWGYKISGVKTHADAARLWLDPGRISALTRACIASTLQAEEQVQQAAAGEPTDPLALTEEMKKDQLGLRSYGLIAADRALVRGPLGNYGLVPEDAQHDDQIAILHGSKTPIVLREVDGKDRFYQVVGQCYWEECMYGEVVDWEEAEGEDSFLCEGWCVVVFV
jgi:hypothetical protein